MSAIKPLAATAGPSLDFDTATQIAAEDWHRVATSTEPTDRFAAEQAVTEIYRLTTGREVREIVWCRSPAEAARLIAADPTRFGRPLRDRIRDKAWEFSRAELVNRLGMSGWTRAWQTACGTLAPTTARLTSRISAAVEDLAADERERVALRIVLTHALHGQQDSAWLPVFDAARHTGTSPSLAYHAMLLPIAEVARNAGWWWPFENVVVMTDRPAELHLDELGRLHRGDGPALAYADGFALHSWRGTAVSADFSSTLATLTPARIRNEENAELRRMMLEYYTYERFVAESGATPVQRDEAGRLWRIDLPGDEPVVMVEVVNSTAEPDGTFNTYWLRVPPTTQTAKAGVAWTFGLTEDEYLPRVQT